LATTFTSGTAVLSFASTIYQACLGRESLNDFPLTSINFGFRRTSISRSRRGLVKMNVFGPRQALPQEAASVGAWTTFVEVFHDVRTPNLIRALAAILFWSLLIGAVSLCYELWRLKHNLRLGIELHP
jgi:hypothetical protein